MWPVRPNMNALLTEPVVCRLSTMGIGLNWRVAIQRFGWRLSFLFSTFFFFHCLLLHRFLSLGNPIIVFHVFPCFLSNRHPLRRVNSVLQGIYFCFCNSFSQPSGGPLIPKSTMVSNCPFLQVGQTRCWSGGLSGRFTFPRISCSSGRLLLL